MDNIVDQLVTVLGEDRSIAFAYLFGSCAHRGEVKAGSDIDIAVFFLEAPHLDRIYALMKKLEAVFGEDVIDLLVLNDCENYVLRNEVLKGTLIFCRAQEAHAGFFSWTLRMYEDEMLHTGKYFTAQSQKHV